MLPVTLKLALQGVVKLPVAVQVKLNQPPSNLNVLALETISPSLSVH